MRYAVNPLQFFDQPDGSLDFDAGPIWPTDLDQVAMSGFSAIHLTVPDGVTSAAHGEALRERGLAPAPGYFSCHLDDVDDVERSLVAARRVAREHKDLGVDAVFVADDLSTARLAQPGVGAERSDDRLTTVISSLSRLADVFRAQGVTPCLHPHVASWIETAEETEAVLAGVGESLAFGPDTGHLTWAGADLIDLVTRHRDRVSALHIKDVHLDVRDTAIADRLNYRETVHRGLWAEPGRGDLNFTAIISALGSGFKGWAVVEVDHTTLTPAESLRLSLEWTGRNRP